MSGARKILLGLLFLFMAMQFIRPGQNRTNEVQKADLIKQFNAPANVAGILTTSCYDCHSNNTRYPCYSNIQPSGWLLAKHIKDGKKELNFSEFGVVFPPTTSALPNQTLPNPGRRFCFRGRFDERGKSLSASCRSQSISAGDRTPQLRRLPLCE